MFHALICSKREKSRGPTEKRPGSTTPRMGTAEKAVLQKGIHFLRLAHFKIGIL